MTLTLHIQNILKNSNKDTEWKKEAEERQAARKESKKAGLIATQLAYYMAMHKISQTDLGKMIGVKPQQISKVLKGRENLTLATIEKIEEALGINLIQVINQETKANSEKEYETANNLMHLAIKKYEEAEKAISDIHTLHSRFHFNLKMIENIKEFKIQELDGLPAYRSLVSKTDYIIIDQPTPFELILEGEDPLVVSEAKSNYSKFELEEK
jgi:transcriptional regulator with XRE-family HTH domain